MRIKAVVLTIILLVIISFPVFAQSDLPPIPNSPPSGRYILDELDWLSNEQEAKLNEIIKRLDNDGLAEIAVVTLNDCGTDKKAFRKLLFDTWGIGHTDDNDGLLILVCWYGGDISRRSVEQLYGPGLNRILSPQKTDQMVQNNFVPFFQQDHPGEGVLKMVSIYDQLIRDNLNKPQTTSQGSGYLLIGFLVFAVSLFIFAINRAQNLPDEQNQSRKDSIRKTRKKKEDTWWWSDGGGGGGFDGGSSDGGGGSSSHF